MLAARSDLLRLAAALRAEPGPPVRGIAAVSLLLTDGTGPLFAPHPAGSAARGGVPSGLPRWRRVSVRGMPGRHKVFLGMAAGVGKTFRMLQEGRAELEAGRDVVIGYLEPHGRVETEAQADGLPLMPRRRTTYKDVPLEEMDLPGILDRAGPSWR